MKDAGVKIPVVGVVKNENHKAKELLGNRELKDEYEKQIILANSEAHRFALGFHCKSRGRAFE